MQQAEDDRERMFAIWHGWYPVCRSAELGETRPRAVVLFDRPLVVFRGPGGAPAALLDRCPHRNVPLSLGRRTASGEIECPYHGWCIDGAGRPTCVPGSLAKLPTVRTPAFAACEQNGLVWIWGAESPPLQGPPVPAHIGAPGYTTIVRSVEAPASLHRTAENALDVPHTSVLHRGLFRSRSGEKVVVEVTRTRTDVTAEYIGESAPSGLVAKVLKLGLPATTSLKVRHFDRFKLPATIEVEYQLGDAAHVLITAYALPSTATQTRLFVFASFKSVLPGRLLALLLEPFARWVFEQDRRILRAQTRALLAWGAPRYASTEIDALGQDIWRLLKEGSERQGEPGPGESELGRTRRFELLV